MRRIRRDARSQTLRERAHNLRQAGWTYVAIGAALGVSTSRALQMVRKAEWLIHESKKQVGPADRTGGSDFNVSRN
jgi:hypothetical protein